MSETPGVPPQPGSAQLERLQQLDRRIAQTVGQLIGSLQEEVDRRLNEATGELQRLFEKMKPSAPLLPGAFLQPEDLSELMPPAPEPVEVPVPVPVRVALDESLAPLLAALARIDGESGQAPILKALLEESLRFASRSAFLLIRGGEIRGWAAQGLPEDVLQQTNFSSLGGPFTRLLSAEGTVVLSAQECADVAALLGVGNAVSGALVPFQIRGQLAGTLYADRIAGEDALEVSALQLLAYGASQVLETSQLRQGSSSALRLGAGEQLPEPPQSDIDVTAPVAIVTEAEEEGLTDAPASATHFAALPETGEVPEVEEPEVEEAPEWTAAPEVAAESDSAEEDSLPSHEPSFSYEPEPTAVESVSEETSGEDGYALPSTSASSFEVTDEAGAVPADEVPAYEPSSFEVSYEAPSMETPAFAEADVEAPSFEMPSFEEPAAEAPSSYEISYPSSFDAEVEAPPAVESLETPSFETPSFETPTFETPTFEASSFETPAYEEPDAFEVPTLEPAPPDAYEPAFEMVPEESTPSFADSPSFEVTYEESSFEVSYEPAAEPSSFDTTFEPAATAEVPTIVRNDVRFAREAPYEPPSEEEIALEKEPEPALEDTNIWEAEEEDDDEPTQIGQSTAAVPQVADVQAPEVPAAPAPAPTANLGQQTVRLDISQLQTAASQMAQERNFGEDTADVRPPVVEPWQPPAAEAPAAYAPTYSPPSFAPPSFAPPEPYQPGPSPATYDQSEAPTMLGHVAKPPASAPPSPAGFAGPAPTEQAPGGFGAGGFGAGEAKEAGGSTEVRPPEDLVGPGRAFAPPAQGPRPSAASGAEETLREEARRLARLLVSEIKLYNEEIIEEGRRMGNIYERLKDDIDRSRQMYEERIDPRLTDQEDYFYQELVQRLAGGDVKLLGL